MDTNLFSLHETITSTAFLAHTGFTKTWKKNITRELKALMKRRLIFFITNARKFLSSLTLFVCSWLGCPYLPPPPRLVLQSACFHTIKANPHPLHRGGGSRGDQWRLTDHINQSFSLWLPLSRSLLSLSVCLCLQNSLSRLHNFNICLIPLSHTWHGNYL